MPQTHAITDDSPGGAVDVDVERVLRARAMALAGRPDDGSGSATDIHVVAVVGEVTVAVPALAVRHVVAVGHLAKLPGSGTAIVGLSAALGTVVPVADGAVLLDVAAAPHGTGARLVLLADVDGDGDGDETLLGLLVDRVEDLVAIDGSEVRPAVEPSSPGPGIVAGVTPDGRHVVDITALLADPRLWPAGSTSPPSRSEGT